VSLAMVIPVMDHLDKHLATASLDEKYSLSIHVALSTGKKTLNWYYNQTDDSRLYWIAMSAS
jgi:hypothetical protein